MSHCCTTPLPTTQGSSEDITSLPLFVDMASGDLHLQSNSPCINAGKSAYVANSTDLDGNPRIVNGTVDIGAYEFQGAGSQISYAWLQRYGLPTDGSADTADPDADSMNNWQEWRSYTDPTNALSVFRLFSSIQNGTDVVLSWPSVTGASYFLERSSNLAAPSPFSSIATNIVGNDVSTSFVDTNAAVLGPFYYRVGVDN